MIEKQIQNQLDSLIRQGLILSYAEQGDTVEIILLHQGSRKVVYLSYQELYRWLSNSQSKKAKIA